MESEVPLHSESGFVRYIQKMVSHQTGGSYFVYMFSNLASLRKLDLSYSSGGVVTDGIVESICTNLPQLEHLDLSGNPGVTDIGTLGLQEDNPVTSSIIGLKDLIAKDGKIILGSK